MDSTVRICMAAVDIEIGLNKMIYFLKLKVTEIISIFHSFWHVVQT